MAETLVFAYVDQGLHRSPAFVSVIVCVQGVGGLTGGLLASRVIRRIGEVGTAALGVLLFAVGFGGFAYPNLVLGFVCAAVLGFGIPLAIVGFNTLLQRVTPAGVMGRVAAQAVLGTDASIASLRGHAHRIDVAGASVPVIVTYHPAYLLRNLADKAKVWADMCLAREVFDRTQPRSH